MDKQEWDPATRPPTTMNYSARTGLHCPRDGGVLDGLRQWLLFLGVSTGPTAALELVLSTKRPPPTTTARRVSLSQCKQYPNRYHPYHTFGHKYEYLPVLVWVLVTHGYHSSPQSSSTRHSSGNRGTTRTAPSQITRTATIPHEYKWVHVPYLLHLWLPPAAATTATATVLSESESPRCCRLPVGIVFQPTVLLDTPTHTVEGLSCSSC